MRFAEAAEVDMGAKQFVVFEEAAALAALGFRVFACTNNPGVRFLRKEGAPDILFYV